MHRTNGTGSLFGVMAALALAVALWGGALAEGALPLGRMLDTHVGVQPIALRPCVEPAR